MLAAATLLLTTFNPPARGIAARHNQYARPATVLSGRSHHQVQMSSPISDGAFVAAAAALVGAAGFLQYSLSSGEKGINAFLMKEKSQNPFYDKNFKAEAPKPPKWMSAMRLPQFSFVEVYGQEQKRGTGLPGGGGGGSGPSLRPDLDDLYEQLDAAVEIEDYEKAAAIKTRIDAA